MSTPVNGLCANLAGITIRHMPAPIPRDPEMIDFVLAAVSAGTPLAQALREAQEQFPHVPAKNTLYGWIVGDPALSDRFARAREMGADAIADEMLAIADAEPRITDEGKIDPADVQLRRLQVETRGKLLAKWAPKRYGDRLEVDSKTDLQLTVTINRAPGLPAGVSLPALSGVSVPVAALPGRDAADDEGGNDGRDD